MRNVIIYILSLFLLLSCKSQPKSFSTVAEGLRYVADPKHGFVRDTLLPNDIKVHVQLIPTSLLQKSNKVEKQKYISIQFSYQGQELLAQLPRDQYGAYVQLFSFGMDRKIKVLTVLGKSYNASLVSYQPTYSMTRSNELLAVFGPDIPLSENVELQIEEFGLNLGLLKFRFSADQLNYNPHIEQL